MMKSILFSFALLLVFVRATGQNKPTRFSPDRFRAEMEQFISKEACLTPQEAASFFPVYDEMNKKQRVIFNQMRQLGKVKPTDEKGCRKAIEKRDQLDVELKQIQQTYHIRFMSIISPSKLFDVIQAEDKFHRRMLKRYNHPKPKPAAEHGEKK